MRWLMIVSYTPPSSKFQFYNSPVLFTKLANQPEPTDTVSMAPGENKLKIADEGI